MIDKIFVWLNEALPDIKFAVFLIAMMPLVETRLAVPVALKSGLSPLVSWFYCVLGSSVVALPLLLVFLPLINVISKIKIFKKSGDYMLEHFNKKAGKIEGTGAKAYLGIFFFSVLPLPLTGVWTACAIAAVLKLSYIKSLGAIIFGNLISGGIITLLCVFLEPYINTIILAITLIAVLAVVLLIVKIILSGKKHKRAV